MIPLTIRSYYSLMWGTSSPEEICAAAKRLGYNRLAITDTNNLYGLWHFLKACKRMGMTPIVGAELTDCVSERRAVCLVENDEGYHNLCRLITCRHSDDIFNLKSAIVGYSKGLVVLTQDRKLLSTWHEAGVTVAATIEQKPDSAGFRLRKTARYLGVPAVATPGSFFLNPADVKIHRMLRAIDLNTSLSRLTPKDTAPSSAWLASASVYAKHFDIWPDAVTDTEKIAERLTFTGPCHGLVLPPWDDKEKHTAEELLRNAAYKG
ncbi:MAG: PHP domain-containing protein, partial [Deltaproteobacteria bacterium]|nr:PHP domain-containing protein [Deltaproteobacteria bacterium]